MDAAGETRERGAEFEGIFRQHGAFVARVLRRFGVKPSDVPDASQDVFLVVHRKLPEFEQRAAHRTWLYRICACVAADYRKRAHRRYERVGDERLDAATPEPQERKAAERQLAACLERALDELREEQRQVFVLYELEELDMIEVARALGCPLKTAFTRLYAARRQLASELRRHGYAGVPLALGVYLPWRGYAAAKLREALATLGLETGTGSSPAGGAAAVLPALQAAPHVAYAGALHAFAAKLWTVGSAAGLIAIATTALSAFAHGPGPMLASMASSEQVAQQLHTRSVRYRVTPRSTAKPARDHAIDRRTRSTRRAQLPSPAVDAQPELAGSTPPAPPAMAAEPQWLRAPEPERPARSAAARPASVGLDEVLSATSIDGLMRFAPARARSGQPFVFVPER